MTNMVPHNLDALIEEAMAEWQVPGVALAVVRDGEPDCLKAYGLREVEANLPVTPDTQFILCSITKSFTALGLALLVDEGRLDWTKPVRDYLPEFRLYDPVATDQVTVLDLLCHHSGLPRHDWVMMPGDISLAEMAAALRHIEPSKKLREEFQYCNLGYVPLGLVAERLSGQSWEAFTLERIMKPLGMSHVGFSNQDLERADDGARPYVVRDPDKSGVLRRERAALWPIRDTPAGGINASASDMANYMHLYLAEGRVGEAQVVSADRLRDLQKPRVYCRASDFPEMGDTHYGLGLASHYYRGERVVSHGGGWIGWSTLLSMIPERRCGVTVLTNSAPSPVTDIVTHAILDHLCGKEQVNWLERFRERRRASTAHRPVNEAAKQAARRPNAPSRTLDEYAGDYTHPAYGRITIEAAGDTLTFAYRGLSGAMSHCHYDVFELDERPTTLWPNNLAITFLYDREGYIDRLAAPFEPMVADIVFRRAACGDALDPAFRERCVGIYGTGAMRIAVALDAEGSLTLRPTGQPTYRLEPYRLRTFAIRELKAFRVEFLSDETGAVTKIVSYQPNGTFEAQRVAE